MEGREGLRLEGLREGTEVEENDLQENREEWRRRARKMSAGTKRAAAAV